MSKRCCPVCAFLLNLLNKHYETKFVISDVHPNVTSCALPEWLPKDIVYLMVREFSRRLRQELSKLQESSSRRGQRGRADSSNTVRASVDSARSGESEPGVSKLREKEFAEEFRQDQDAKATMGKEL